MTQFDQHGQQVTNQYHAGREMNFGAVQNRVDFVTELEHLKEQFTQARKVGMLDEPL